MDLSLLPHLSDRALREEAERRGIGAEGLDRAQLMDAIRAHEGRAMTVPPGDAPSPFAATIPPEPEPRGRGQSILDRVIGLARGAIRRRSEPPRAAEEAPEPIETRSMARLLEQQGHLERALAIVRKLEERDADAELRAWRERLERSIAQSALRDRARARLERSGTFAEVIAERGARAIVWRVDDEGLARGRELLGAKGALTLRVIRVLAHPDHSVESRQEDRRPLEASGFAIIDSEPSAKIVASVGVADGERFVSIAHAAG